jgi:hypothetical protein
VSHTRLAFSPRGTVGFERKAAKLGLRSSVMLKANNSPSTFSRIPAYRVKKKNSKNEMVSLIALMTLLAAV